MAALGQYFGLCGPDPEALATGKRRTVVWFSLITFLLLVGSTAGPDWILGGLEFGGSSGGGVGVANQAHFHVNLNTVLIEVFV